MWQLIGKRVHKPTHFTSDTPLFFPCKSPAKSTTNGLQRESWILSEALFFYVCLHALDWRKVSKSNKKASKIKGFGCWRIKELMAEMAEEGMKFSFYLVWNSVPDGGLWREIYWGWKTGFYVPLFMGSAQPRRIMLFLHKMVFNHFMVPCAWHTACGGVRNVLTTFSAALPLSPLCAAQ